MVSARLQLDSRFYLSRWPNLCCPSVCFCPTCYEERERVQDGIYALRKDNIRSATLVSRKFPHRCLSNNSNVGLTALSRLFEDDRRANTSSSYASPLQAIDGVESSALCRKEASQAPQHLGSSKKTDRGARQRRWQRSRPDAAAVPTRHCTDWRKWRFQRRNDRE